MATTALRALLDVIGTRPAVVVQHVHRVGVVTVRLPNGRLARLWTPVGDAMTQRLFWYGWSGYEPETTGPFFAFAARAAVTFDVGAHVGWLALLAAHANRDARVFAFEPLAEVFERLQRHVRLNELTNVECIRAAASDRNGTAEFFHALAGEALPTGSSLSLEQATGLPAGSAPVFEVASPERGVQRSRVEVMTLDHFVSEHGIAKVDLMKIDTEATEPLVLRGMSATLARDRPHIFCEVLPQRDTAAALDELLRPHGYRYYHLTDAGPVPCEQIVGHPTFWNYLFTTLDPTALQNHLATATVPTAPRRG